MSIIHLIVENCGGNAGALLFTSILIGLAVMLIWLFVAASRENTREELYTRAALKSMEKQRKQRLDNMHVAEVNKNDYITFK